MRERNMLTMQRESAANQEMAGALEQLAKTAKPEFAPDYLKAAFAIRTTPPGKKPPKWAIDVHGLMLRQVQSTETQGPSAATQAAAPPAPTAGAAPPAGAPPYAAPTTQPPLPPPPSEGAPAPPAPPAPSAAPMPGGGPAPGPPPPAALNLPGGGMSAMGGGVSAGSRVAAVPPAAGSVPFPAAMPPALPGLTPPPGMQFTQLTDADRMAASMASTAAARSAYAAEARALFGPNADPYDVANYIQGKELTRPSAAKGGGWASAGQGIIYNAQTGEFKLLSQPNKTLHVVAGNLVDETGKVLFSAPLKPEDKTFEEQMFADYLSASQGDPAAQQRVQVRAKQLGAEAAARGEPLAGLRGLNAALLQRLISPPGAPGGPVLPASVDQVIDLTAQRVASGELSPQDAQRLLGGQRGGLGAALITKIASLNARIVPPKTREALNNVNIGLGQIDQVEELVNAVIASKTPEERAKNVLLLESYGQTIAARLARANGEVGVLTEQDVNRSIALIPGWKAANFAPDYARRELQLVRSNYDKVRNALGNQYFAQFERTPGLTPPPGAAGVAPTTPSLVSPPGAVGRIRVRRKSDGQTGTIESKDFDSARYDRVQ
mgnify:CR=1 FL=1